MGKAIDLPPVWLACAIALAWLQTRHAPVGPEPGLLRLIGTGLIGLGVALIAAAAVCFARARTTIIPHQEPVRLIDTGVFAHSRNPIYLGDTAILAGVCLWLGAWPSLVLVPLFVALTRWRFIGPEEARMRAAFGDAFAEYERNVRRWL